MEGGISLENCMASKKPCFEDHNKNDASQFVNNIKNKQIFTFQVGITRRKIYK
jgi:hypothetical protein